MRYHYVCEVEGALEGDIDQVEDEVEARAALREILKSHGLHLKDGAEVRIRQLPSDGEPALSLFG